MAVCAALLIMAGCATMPSGQAPPALAAAPPALASAEIITRVFPGESPPATAQEAAGAALTPARS